jgi:hypothetical protein
MYFLKLACKIWSCKLPGRCLAIELLRVARITRKVPVKMEQRLHLAHHMVSSYDSLESERNLSLSVHVDTHLIFSNLKPRAC